MAKGRFGVIEGLDGSGKGTAIKEILEFERSIGGRVFDSNEWWGNIHDLSLPPIHDYNATPSDLTPFTVMSCSEPTYAGVGRRIRTEYTNDKTGRKHDPKIIANAFALDRYELYQSLIISAREAYIDIIQSRNVVSSLVYQPIHGQMNGSDINLDYVMNIPGNAFALLPENMPSLVIIQTIKDIKQLERRLVARDKKDDSVFEREELQRRMKEAYESDWLRRLLEERGTVVKYLDTGISEEYTKEQTVKIWREHLGLTQPFT